MRSCNHVCVCVSGETHEYHITVKTRYLHVSVTLRFRDHSSNVGHSAIRVCFHFPPFLLHLIRTCVCVYMFQRAKSNTSQVTLYDVDFYLAGTFSCEVTADAPTFSTLADSKNLTVVCKYMLHIIAKTLHIIGDNRSRFLFPVCYSRRTKKKVTLDLRKFNAFSYLTQ